MLPKAIFDLSNTKNFKTSTDLKFASFETPQSKSNRSRTQSHNPSSFYNPFAFNADSDFTVGNKSKHPLNIARSKVETGNVIHASPANLFKNRT